MIRLILSAALGYAAVKSEGFLKRERQTYSMVRQLAQSLSNPRNEIAIVEGAEGESRDAGQWTRAIYSENAPGLVWVQTETGDYLAVWHFIAGNEDKPNSMTSVYSINPITLKLLHNAFGARASYLATKGVSDAIAQGMREHYEESVDPVGFGGAVPRSEDESVPEEAIEDMVQEIILTKPKAKA